MAALHAALAGSGRGATPIITFNAEIDRIRTGCVLLWLGCWRAGLIVDAWLAGGCLAAATPGGLRRADSQLRPTLLLRAGTTPRSFTLPLGKLVKILSQCLQRLTMSRSVGEGRGPAAASLLCHAQRQWVPILVHCR